MAQPIDYSKNLKSSKFKYKSRAPYYNQIDHLNDNFKNLGYSYRGQLYNKTTSAQLWANPLQRPFFARLEGMMTFLVETTKYIKKTFSIAHSKETLDIN